MPPLAATGTLIEVTPWDDLQWWPDATTPWSFVDDRAPFRFRVAGELMEGGTLYGLQGPVESGPAHYLGLVCSIFPRFDNSDWHHENESGADFKVGPSVAKRAAGYRPEEHDDVPFHQHPEGTVIEGYPRISRFGGIRAIG